MATKECYMIHRLEMERIIASKDDEISQLQVQNKHLVSYCDELQTRTKQKETEKASKDEQIALLQLGSKELTDLQEELKQYKKLVDSYKEELERCQKELERCQGELLEVHVHATRAMVQCKYLVVWLVMCMHLCVGRTCMCASVCVCVHVHVSCVLVCVMCTLVHSCTEKDAVGGTQGLRSKIST